MPAYKIKRKLQKKEAPTVDPFIVDQDDAMGALLSSGAGRPRRAHSSFGSSASTFSRTASSSSSVWHLPWPIVSFEWMSVVPAVTSKAPDLAHLPSGPGVP